MYTDADVTDVILVSGDAFTVDAGTFRRLSYGREYTFKVAGVDHSGPISAIAVVKH